MKPNAVNEMGSQRDCKEEAMAEEGRKEGRKEGSKQASKQEGREGTKICTALSSCTVLSSVLR